MNTIIAAMDPNKVIGKDGKLPWYISDEMRHFARTTKNGTLIMGRKTFESIGKPLVNRDLLVVSSNFKRLMDTYRDERVKFFPNLSTTIGYCRHSGKHPFIIGGGRIYEQTLANNWANKMILSYIKTEYEGDTFFPKFDESLWNKLVVLEHELFTVVEYDFKG